MSCFDTMIECYKNFKETGNTGVYKIYHRRDFEIQFNICSPCLEITFLHMRIDYKQELHELIQYIIRDTIRPIKFSDFGDEIDEYELTLEESHNGRYKFYGYKFLNVDGGDAVLVDKDMTNDKYYLLQF